MMVRLSFSLFFIAGAAAAQELPLFAAPEGLHVIIEADMSTIVRQRSKRPEVPAVVRYSEKDGTVVEVPMMLTTRGHSRLELCGFPPLSQN